MPLLPPSLNTRPGSQSLGVRLEREGSAGFASSAAWGRVCVRLAMPVPKHLPLQLPARPPGSTAVLPNSTTIIEVDSAAWPGAVDDDNPDQRGC